jgi:hypothetical protein
MEREIWVAEPCLPQLYAQLEKINAKARKYEIPELSVTELQRQVRTNIIGGELMQVTAVLVRIEGAVVRAGPWSVIATMHERQSTRRVTLLRGAPVLTAYLSDPLQCEHCNKNRRRQRTFIVMHDIDGFSRQVGHSCLHEYTGISLGQVAAGARIAAYLNSLEEKAEQWLASPRYYGPAPYALADVLAAACAAIRVHGWRNAKTQDTSTADEVRLTLADPSRLAVLEADREEAARVLERAQAHFRTHAEIENDFEARLQAVLHTGQVLHREVGVAAWLAHRFGANYLPPAVSEHVGKPGMRIETAVRVTRIVGLPPDGYGGVPELVTLTDNAGNQLLWRTSRRPREMREGETLNIKGTVKKHGEWRGCAQTELSRVTVQPAAKPAESAAPVMATALTF